MRMYKPEELKFVYRMLSDPNVTRYYPPGFSVNQEDILSSMPRRLDRWRTQGFGQLGVFDKVSGRPAGYCGLQHLDGTAEIELFYGLTEEFWGRGLATEAARAMLRFGFETVTLASVCAVTHPENIASQRILDKLGFARAVEPKRFYGLDLVYFAFHGEDFEPGGSEYRLSWQESSPDQFTTSILKTQ